MVAAQLPIHLIMINLRKYGAAPFSVAVIHGGPGGAGGMAPLAKALAKNRGILEPLQTAQSLEGQVKELRTVLSNNADTPVVLIGHSWGAWLSYIVAARYPDLVKKLILVGSGPFEEKYVNTLAENRFKRLSEKEKSEFEHIVTLLNDPRTKDKDKYHARLRDLSYRTDTYDPITDEPDEADASELVDCSGEIYQAVWEDAAELRRTGKLLELGQYIKCPVVAIHGEYDPHPAEGVQEPLRTVLKDFRFILLEKCGHDPWHEKQARESYCTILENELAV